MKLSTKSLKLMALAAAAPLVLATAPAHAEEKAKASREAIEAYIGPMTKNAIAQNVLDRLLNNKRAPKLEATPDRVKFWHGVLLDSVAIDHTPDPETGPCSIHPRRSDADEPRTRDDLDCRL